MLIEVASLTYHRVANVSCHHVETPPSDYKDHVHGLMMMDGVGHTKSYAECSYLSPINNIYDVQRWRI